MLASSFWEKTCFGIRPLQEMTTDTWPYGNNCSTTKQVFIYWGCETHERFSTKVFAIIFVQLIEDNNLVKWCEHTYWIIKFIDMEQN